MRVTTPGVNVTFPLRMVAAGVADSVALELFIIADGRYEIANFPNLEIPRDELTFNPSNGTFNYMPNARSQRFSWIAKIQPVGALGQR